MSEQTVSVPGLMRSLAGTVGSGAVVGDAGALETVVVGAGVAGAGVAGGCVGAGVGVAAAEHAPATIAAVVRIPASRNRNELTGVPPILLRLAAPLVVHPRRAPGYR